MDNVQARSEWIYVLLTVIDLLVKITIPLWFYGPRMIVFTATSSVLGLRCTSGPYSLVDIKENSCQP